MIDWSKKSGDVSTHPRRVPEPHVKKPDNVGSRAEMEPRRPLSRAELKKFSRPRASPKASVLDNFGDKRRTVRYLTFIYDKVSLDRP